MLPLASSLTSQQLPICNAHSRYNSAVTQVSKLKATVLNDTVLMAWHIVGLNETASASAPLRPSSASGDEANLEAQQERERELTRKCQTMCIFMVKVLDMVEARQADVSGNRDEAELEKCVRVAVVQAGGLLAHTLSLGMDRAFVAIGSKVMKKLVGVHPNVLSLVCPDAPATPPDNHTAGCGRQGDDVDIVSKNDDATLDQPDDDLWDSEVEEEELLQTEIEVEFITSNSVDGEPGTDGTISPRGQACIVALLCAYGECTESVPVVTSLSHKLACFAPHISTLLSDPDPMVARRALLVTRRLCGSLHPFTQSSLSAQSSMKQSNNIGEGGFVVPQNAWAQYLALLSNVCRFMSTCPESRLRSAAHGCLMDVLACISAPQRMCALETMSVAPSLTSPAKGLLLDAMKKVGVLGMCAAACL
jgi:hypothetical protein